MSKLVSNSATSVDVSVVIVSFNTRELLRECLQTLDRETSKVSYETIVVDNASADGSADMVEKEFPRVKLVRSAVNLGFAAANNRGFALAEGRYVSQLNSDAFVNPGALDLVVKHMDARPQVGLGGGRLVGRDGSWQPSLRKFPSPLNEALNLTGLAAKYRRSRFFGRADKTWADPLESGPADWVPGAFTLIRREVLEQIGHLDERFFLYLAASPVSVRASFSGEGNFLTDGCHEPSRPTKRPPLSPTCGAASICFTATSRAPGFTKASELSWDT